MENRVGKKNEQEWQDIVINNFDNFKDQESNFVSNQKDVPNTGNTEDADDSVFELKKLIKLKIHIALAHHR